MTTLERKGSYREAQSLIAKAQRENSTSLDLSDLRLSELPPEIGSLNGLQALDLSNNHLTTLPTEIAALTALQELDLDNNLLNSLAPEIASLTALRQLFINNNQLDTLPPEIASLTALKALFLINNQIRTLPPEITSLAALKALSLANNQLNMYPPEIASLTALQQLFLNNNQIDTLPPEIASLTALWQLDLSNNQLSTLPTEIASLSALRELYLNNNRLNTLPPEIGSLTALSVLHLINNQLAALPPALRQLKRLRSLALHRNPRLKLSPTILGPDPNTPGLDVDILPSATSILDFYFGRLASSARPLNEVKLILVGRGGAGKTSIVRALRGLPFRHTEASTPGIALADWEMRGCKGGDVTAHIWDFAGQVITHALHQFFFSVRTVYVLVLTGRENSEREDAEYWLRLIKAFGTGDDGESPDVVVALNKWDVNGCRPKVDRSALAGALSAHSRFCRSRLQDKQRNRQARRNAQATSWTHEMGARPVQGIVGPGPPVPDQRKPERAVPVIRRVSQALRPP